MQNIAPVSAVYNPNAYTSDEVLNELRGKRGTRNMTFRYELLDAANQKIMDLTNVIACTVEHNWLADVKRKAKFTVRDTGEIDFLSNRIKPYARLNMPPVPVTEPYTDVLNVNPYFEGGVNNWQGFGGTISQSSVKSHEGTSSMLLTPSGVNTFTTADCDDVSVTPGEEYTASAWVNSAAGNTTYIGIDWYNSSGVFFSNDYTTPATMPVNTWTFLTITATAPAGAAAGRLVAIMNGTQPSSNTLHVDEAKLAHLATRVILNDGGYVEWPQGVFLLSSPNRNADETDTVTREVEAYDALQVFLDDLVENRYTVAAGTVYTTAVSTLLGSIAKNITTSTKTVPVALEWEPGTPKLKIINNLLSAINYDALYFDEDGVAIVKPYVAPSSRAEEYTYADDEDSVMIPDVDQELDLFSIPNKWVLVVSEPDRAPLVATYTNNDPSSPTSVVRRQRTIVDFRTETEAADQASLDARVARLAFESSQIYEAVDFVTAIMPIHSGNDVYRITYSTLAIDAKYSEHSWSMPLVAGGTMQHKVRRVVTI